MLYQLRKLSAQEQTIMLQAPIWVSLLIACADMEINEDEIKKAKEFIRLKTFTEESDVRNLYRELNEDIDHAIEVESHAMPFDGQERITYLSDKLAQLNKILPKLELRYAIQFHRTLKELALSVAQSEGGLLGIGTVSHKEEEFISLPMIETP